MGSKTVLGLVGARTTTTHPHLRRDPTISLVLYTRIVFCLTVREETSASSCSTTIYEEEQPRTTPTNLL